MLVTACRSQHGDGRHRRPSAPQTGAGRPEQAQAVRSRQIVYGANPGQCEPSKPGAAWTLHGRPLAYGSILGGASTENSDGSVSEVKAFADALDTPLDPRAAGIPVQEITGPVLSSAAAMTSYGRLTFTPTRSWPAYGPTAHPTNTSTTPPRATSRSTFPTDHR
jgi:hypothetical protein